MPLLADGSAVDRSAHVPPTTLGRAPVRVRVGPHGHDAAAATAAALRAQTLGRCVSSARPAKRRLGHLGRRRVRASRHHVQHEGRAGERGRLLPQSDVQFIIAGEADAVAHRVRLDELAFGMQRTWRDSAECEANAVLIEEELVRQAHADLCRLRRELLPPPAPFSPPFSLPADFAAAAAMALSLASLRCRAADAAAALPHRCAETCPAHC